MAYFAKSSPNAFPIYVVIVALLLIDFSATIILLQRPEALGARDQYSDQFASLLGVTVYNGFHPYLKNLPQAEIVEALAYLEGTLTADVTHLATRREKMFVKEFTAKIVAQGNILLAPRGTSSR